MDVPTKDSAAKTDEELTNNLRNIHPTGSQNAISRAFEAELINADTAEVTWHWGYVVDPYEEWPHLDEELRCIGRIYFARDPDRKVWICFYDLPDDVRQRMQERISDEAL